jgi:hypothetical protein
MVESDPPLRMRRSSVVESSSPDSCSPTTAETEPWCPVKVASRDHCVESISARPGEESRRGTHVLLVFLPDVDRPCRVSRDEVAAFTGTLNKVESGYVALVTRQRVVHACRQFVLIAMASS